MSVEENREIRPVRKKRKLRWGRLVFVQQGLYNRSDR